MEKLRIMSVFGTRPEAIKMAPLVKVLAEREEIESICCVTAQHREMLDSVLDIFKIKPDYDLNIMAPRQTLASITTKILNQITIHNKCHCIFMLYFLNSLLISNYKIVTS